MPEHVGLRGSPRARWSRFRCALAALTGCIAAAPLAASPTFPDPPQATVQPALWVVSDEDTTIFLFGTFHALDSATDWFAPKIQAAFAVSDQLVLETVIPSDPAELAAALARRQLLAPAVPGQPVIASAPSQGFVRSASKAIATGRTIGLSVDSGADAVLRRTAEQLGKHVAGLESFDFQIGLFEAVSNAPVLPAPAVQQAPLGEVMVGMRDSWKAGDAGRFAAMLGTIERQSPAAYRLLYADRNERWAQWIADRLQRPGTAFVAVGAGHFVGRDSVQAKLARHGIRTNRVS